MTFNTYVVTLRHDGGRVKIKVGASSPEAAVRAVCNAENAPASAVCSVVAL